MRKLWLLAACLALAAGASQASALADPAQPLDPPVATADANAVVNDADTVRATQTTAAGLASLTSSAPVAPGDRSSEGLASVPAGQPCWYVGYGAPSLASQWGYWPYEQIVKEWRQWCAQYIGGPQTYRVSEMHIGEDLCSDHDHYMAKIHGGNGYTYTSMETESHFDCPTDVPWVVIHTDRVQIWKCDTTGNCVRTYKS